jgi:hypothetical protein
MSLEGLAALLGIALLLIFGRPVRPRFGDRRDGGEEGF